MPAPTTKSGPPTKPSDKNVVADKKKGPSDKIVRRAPRRPFRQKRLRLVSSSIFIGETMFVCLSAIWSERFGRRVRRPDPALRPPPPIDRARRFRGGLVPTSCHIPTPFIHIAAIGRNRKGKSSPSHKKTSLRLAEWKKAVAEPNLPIARSKPGCQFDWMIYSSLHNLFCSIVHLILPLRLLPLLIIRFHNLTIPLQFSSS